MYIRQWLVLLIEKKPALPATSTFVFSYKYNRVCIKCTVQYTVYSTLYTKVDSTVYTVPYTILYTEAISGID